MIHDAEVEVTCDTEGCRDSIRIPLDYKYGGIMHADGRYEFDQQAIEEKLTAAHWVVEAGKHYCGDLCKR